MMLEQDLRSLPSEIKKQTVVSSEPKTLQAPKADAQTGTLLTNARLLRKAGETDLALNLLRVASSRDSKNPIVLRALAEALEDKGKHQESLMARAALAKADYGFETVYEHAQALYRCEKDAEALNMYFEALSLLGDEHPALFEINKNVGNIYVRQGDFESAEESYNKAYALNPDSDALFVNFGTLEVQRGDLGRSLACFRRAVDLNPSNDRAWTGLAMVHNEFGDFELAQGNLERALDLNAANRTAVLLLAHWAVRDKVPYRAIERVEAYLSSVESDEEISLVLINLFSSVGSLDLAAIETERVYAWNPERSDIRQLRGTLRNSGAI